MDDVEAKLLETEKEADKARKDSKTAREQFNEIKRKRYVYRRLYTTIPHAMHSCELFNKAYNHISERIDQVYKDLTKGKMAPTGGVAYLTLEDSEVSRSVVVVGLWLGAHRLYRNRIRLVSSTTRCLR